jgi:phenylalanyl-tRNA synthetase beta chain
MLCIEGIALNLNIFLGRTDFPDYRLNPSKPREKLIVEKSTEQIRPLVSCAILRNIKFDKKRYNSFIALQDKLHANLARQRTLVSIGTHDLDTIEGPFYYKALKPTDIEFTPLNQKKKMNAEELMTFYEKDRHLGRFLHIIRDSPVYPVIYDSKGTVLSLPPIINGDHSKISVDTKNVLIEITATDKTKLEIVNHIMVTMFSTYCEEPFSIEPVEIVSPHNNESRITPDLTPTDFSVESAFLNACTGLSLEQDGQCKLLTKMALSATPSSKTHLAVKAPITRADILHATDVMEDMAIAYGFNKLPRQFPMRSATIGAPLPLNQLTDILRLEAAEAGWTEVMPLTLCSHDENFAHLNRIDDGTQAIRLQNPKTAEYQMVRTSLLPGLLKTLRENKSYALPLKIFESGDVGLKAPELERRTRNERHFAAAWCGKVSGFEVVHGLLDRLLKMLRVPFIEQSGTDKLGYWIEELECKCFSVGIYKIDGS